MTGHTWSSDGSGLIVGGVLGDFVQGVTGSAELDASVAMDTFGKWVSPARLMVTQFKDYFGLAHDLPKWASEGAKAAGEAAKALPAAVPAIPSAGLSGVAGAVGQAASVGGLKVPAVWTATTPAGAPRCWRRPTASEPRPPLKVRHTRLAGCRSWVAVPDVRLTTSLPLDTDSSRP